MGSIEGKSALVTGATRGIGLAIAKLLLDVKAKVFICARTSQETRDLVRRLSETHGDRVHGSACDVRDYEQVRSMFAEVKRLWGGLDVLVNNAGVGSHSFVEQMPVDEWQSTIETNLTGVFHCCHEGIPLMKSRGGGYVINIGSLAGKSAFPGAAAYCASKFGLIGFSEALMQEVRYDHIRVSYVMPGSVNTGFGGKAAVDSDASWKLAPEDVARTVLSLLEMDPRALPSRVELRPSEPKK